MISVFIFRQVAKVSFRLCLPDLLVFCYLPLEMEGIQENHLQYFSQLRTLHKGHGIEPIIQCSCVNFISTYM